MEPLEIAVKMEIEGKEFYLKASDKAGDQLGQKLFLQLAGEEDRHAATARKIHDALKQRKGIPKVDISFDQGKKLNSLFAKATKEIARKNKVTKGELEAIGVALDMEEKSRKFYEEHSVRASDSFEKQFFRALTAEERGHYIALTDYREYLTDPAGWLRRAEHPSLDGG